MPGMWLMKIETSAKPRHKSIALACRGMRFSARQIRDRPDGLTSMATGRPPHARSPQRPVLYARLVALWRCASGVKLCCRAARAWICGAGVSAREGTDAVATLADRPRASSLPRRVYVLCRIESSAASSPDPRRPLDCDDRAGARL